MDDILGVVNMTPGVTNLRKDNQYNHVKKREQYKIL